MVGWLVSWNRSSQYMVLLNRVCGLVVPEGESVRGDRETETETESGPAGRGGRDGWDSFGTERRLFVCCV